MNRIDNYGAEKLIVDIFTWLLFEERICDKRLCNITFFKRSIFEKNWICSVILLRAFDCFLKNKLISVLNNEKN